MLRPALLALSAVLLLPACGSEVEETKGSTGQTTTPNKEPVWNDAPTAPVAIGQGQTIELSLNVEDPDGDTVTATAAPPAGLEVETSTGASGSSVLTLHADYTLSGASSFDITFDDGRGGTATTTVAVEIAPIRWLENPTWTEAEGPEAREHGSLIVDPDGTQTFLFGGSGYTPYLEPFDDAWRYDTAAGTWSAVTPAGDVPAPGGSRRVAHIPGQKVAYLFGGYGGNQGATTFGDLYRVTIEGQGLTFKLLSQTTPPPKRALHAFAYDPGTDRFVIFGGASTALLNDTWIGTLAGDNVTWEKLTTDPTPSKRYGFFSGFDAERGRLLVFRPGARHLGARHARRSAEVGAARRGRHRLRSHGPAPLRLRRHGRRDDHRAGPVRLRRPPRQAGVGRARPRRRAHPPLERHRLLRHQPRPHPPRLREHVERRVPRLGPPRLLSPNLGAPPPNPRAIFTGRRGVGEDSLRSIRVHAE